MKTAIPFVICTVLTAVSLPGLAGEPRRTITVSARSEVMVAPDEVMIAARVTTHDKNVIKAKSANDVITELVLKVAKSHDLPQKDIEITGMDLSPVHDRFGEFVHYEFERSIEFTLSDFHRIEPLISDLVESGVSQIDRLHFRVADQRKHQIEARRQAVEYAKVKASHLAELNGQRLGRALRIREEVEDNWDVGSGFGGGAGMGGGYLGASVKVRPDAKWRVVGAHNSSAKRVAPRPDATSGRFRLATWNQNDSKEKTGEKVASPDKNENKNARDGEDPKLLAPGQIGINATVTIVFELLSGAGAAK